MIATALRTARRPGKGVAKPQGLLVAISKALDAYATYRLKKAVPVSELQRAERTISHFHRRLTRAAPAR